MFRPHRVKLQVKQLTILHYTTPMLLGELWERGEERPGILLPICTKNIL